jgi:Protein of unknown function (DUF1475)
MSTPRAVLVTLFALILLTMLVVTTSASFQESLFAIPPVVTQDPWFQATLFDAYFGFITFYAWVFYRSPQWPARVGWLIAILLGGNVTMAIYGLYRLWVWPRPYRADTLLLRPEHRQPC